MIVLFFSALLIVGYVVYGSFVEKIFGVDDRPTPATTMTDGIDYIPMPTWKVFFIQLLDIAGIGPVFGPILAALYGPSCLLWIVIGSIFAGGVHDFFSGWASMRNRGQNINEIVGDALGMPMRYIMRAMSLLLLLLVGVVFVLSPAKLLAELIGGPVNLFTALIFAYYFAAVVMPIDKIIGRIYPLFGGLLIVMSISIGGGMLYDKINESMDITALHISLFIGVVVIISGLLTFFLLRFKSRLGLLIKSGNSVFGFLVLISTVVVGIIMVIQNGNTLSDMDFFTNVNPEHKPIWPLMFITLSCGALSGFHSTQSPIMARCITSERQARKVFYGAMIAEGIIALIWATVALTFYDTPSDLQSVIAAGTPALVVQQSAIALLGGFGYIAVLGVIILPITSGDTAFRCARLIIADIIHSNQSNALNRLIIAIPIFIVGFLVSLCNFSLVWRYFGWANQTLAMLTLWSAAVFLARDNKCHWIATLPALFMTAVTITFIMYAPIGFRMSLQTSTIIGCSVTTISGIAFLYLHRKNTQVKKSDGIID
ncbi:MAG: carbon starvation protein A [Spartobacteria bacterium]|nr:carbon starvation protein A [Spartobacteria bacterium]